MNAFAAAITHYLTSFSAYLDPLLQWGQWLFLSLLTINLVWMALWHAFDQDSFSQSMPAFIRKFFGIAVFYTLMIHPAWLMQLLQTAEFMGGSLTKVNLTPQAVIASGIALGNKILVPLSTGNLFAGGLLGFVTPLLVAMLVLLAFLGVALDLLVTLITTTLLISMASFFLGLAPQSQTVARQTLNILLRNCVKLLGLYLVIAVGLQTMRPLDVLVPTQYTELDPYIWISAVVLLFWWLAKRLPRQLSDIVDGFIETNAPVVMSPLSVSALSQTQAIGIEHPGAEKTGSVVGAPLHQAISSSLDRTPIQHPANIATGNLSGQFRQIVRKLAIQKSSMPRDRKHIQNKQEPTIVK